MDLKNLKQEIIHNSLRLVDEFTLDNYSFYTASAATRTPPPTTAPTKLQSINEKTKGVQKKPILVAVVDSILDVGTTKRLLSMLESLAKQFVHSLHITWVEGNLNPEKKKMLGISARAPLPQVAFFRIDDYQ